MSTIDDKIAEQMPYLRVARRKGGRVRLQNINTAKMGRWIKDPYSPLSVESTRARISVQAGRRAGKTAALQAEVRNYWRTGDAAQRVDRLTVRELQTNLRTAGIAYTSRMRKQQLVGLLLGTEGEA